MDRRRFIGSTSAILAANSLLAACASRASNESTRISTFAIDGPGEEAKQVWLGQNWWANRLQDWRREEDQLICVAQASDLQMRTAHCLTRSIEKDFGPARLSVIVKNQADSGDGLAGILVGAGGGTLDYRGAALVQRFSGEGGGLLALVDADGRPSFRAFDRPADQLDYALFGSGPNASRAGAANRPLLLEFDVIPLAERCDLRLCVSDAESGEELGCAVAPQIEKSRVVGNIALAASPPGEGDSAKWAFSQVASGGGVSRHPERSLGPVMACLHSLNRDIMRFTVQFMPLSVENLPEVRFEGTSEGGNRHLVTEPIGDGFAAVFRVDGWDHTAEHTYRIVDPRSPDMPLFEGVIQADPGSSRPLSIALHSCLLPTARSLDEANYQPRIPQERAFGRYSSDNILFPHAEMVERCEAQEPDLYVFAGDQYYETYPTRRGHDGPDALLDTLYRWYLFLWTFREPLRSKPAIVLVDDHDILQGNLWGDGGENSELPREEDGGFKRDKHLVRTIYRIQTSHNPDPWDDTRIAYDIPVCFGHFVYGGTSFAFVEDRKFKDPPREDIPPEAAKGELLGKRQEAFLEEWAQLDPGLPKICLTASIWGSPQTAGNLDPLIDYDSNGYPVEGRNRGVQLLKDAGAVALAGDQHLAMLAIQGIETHDDGPLFFAGPAGSAFWQRWFEGLGKLSNKRLGDPNTGDFVDCFGNPMRVLAVANPRIGYEEFMSSKDYWGNFVGDHRLKSEGFGIVRVDSADRAFTFECWPRSFHDSVDRQFPGWPYRHPFPRP